jgi:hypothetical protein
MRCSNPNCRRPTSGPHEHPSKVTNIGVAAHITAASPKGPRYDPAMTPEARRSPENGIWLCQSCAKFPDNDPLRYPVELLRQWKRLSEAAARLEIDSPALSQKGKPDTDESLVRFYAQCFDRNAFQVPFHQEGSMEAFDRAIEDTITALNTGCLRSSRDGAVLATSKGKTYLKNPVWREKLDTVTDLLRAIRSRYVDAKKSGIIHDGDNYHCIHDSDLSRWMDETRSQALGVFGEVCTEAGVTPPVFPRPVPRW